MARETLLETEGVTVWYDLDRKLVHLEARGFGCGDPFRAALNTGTSALRRYGARKWLSDARGQSALPREDQEWCDTDWFPRTVAAGWKHWALVLPEKVVGQMGFKRIAARYAELGVTARVFTDLDEALRWLETQ